MMTLSIRFFSIIALCYCTSISCYANSSSLHWHACPKQNNLLPVLQCTELQVPYDYAKPVGKKLTLTIARYSRLPKPDKPVLIVNFGGAAQLSTLCYDWPVAAEPLPTIQLKDNKIQVLIVANKYDSATPLSWSKQLVKQIGNSQLLLWNGVGHGIYAMNDVTGACITKDVNNFLLHLTFPPKHQVCREFVNPFSSSKK